MSSWLEPQAPGRLRSILLRVERNCQSITAKPQCVKEHKTKQEDEQNLFMAHGPGWPPPKKRPGASRSRPLDMGSFRASFFLIDRTRPHGVALTRRNNLELALMSAAGTVTVICSTGVALLDVGAPSGVRTSHGSLRVVDDS